MIAVFAAGTGVRALFMLSYRPGFLGITDSGSYITAAHGPLFIDVLHPAGYPLLLRGLHAVDGSLSFAVLVQHLLGIAAAALLYLTVRRAGGGLLALLPAAVVLLDGFGIWVEHTPLADGPFTFVVTAGLYAAVRSRGQPVWAPWAGLLFGTATIIRPAGSVLIPLAAIWTLLALEGRTRQRLVAALGLLACGIAPVVAYLGVQKLEPGFDGLSPAGGRALYARVAPFADCSRFTPPAGTNQLCERTPRSRRGGANQYLWGARQGQTSVSMAQRKRQSPAWRVFGGPPAGDARLREFALAVIAHQPLDYASKTVSDLGDYATPDFRKYLDAAAQVVPGVQGAVVHYYSTAPGVYARRVSLLRSYVRAVAIRGPLGSLLMGGSLLALVAAPGYPRRAAVLLALAGWLLLIAPTAALGTDARYALPAWGPLCGALTLGAYGLAGRLRSRSPHPTLARVPDSRHRE